MDNLEQLMADVRAIKDRQDIEDCLRRYSRGMDRSDRELARSAYHPDALDDHGGVYIGSGYGLVDWATDGAERSYERSYHYVTNVSIAFDGDTAHVESYFLFYAQAKGTFRVDQVGGRYIDRFERRDGVWAIAARICTTEWTIPPELAEQIAPLGLPTPRDSTDPSYRRPLTVERAPMVLPHP